MIDAWTQTSNYDTDQSKDDTNIKNDLSSFMTHHSLKSDKKLPSFEESTMQSYKSNNYPSKFRVRVNSTIKDNRTFRSPLKNRASNDYNSNMQYLDEGSFNSNQ